MSRFSESFLWKQQNGGLESWCPSLHKAKSQQQRQKPHPKTVSRQMPNRDSRHSGRLFLVGFQVSSGQCASQGSVITRQCASLKIFQNQCLMWWRRRRDSNPRDPLEVCALSRGVPSTTRPRLRLPVYWGTGAGARGKAARRALCIRVRQASPGHGPGQALRPDRRAAGCRSPARRPRPSRPPAESRAG